MSRGRVGAVGNDAASSAQSKCAGGDKTVSFGSSRGEQGCTGGNGAVNGEQGVSTVVDGVVSDAAGVSDVVGSKTVRCWVFWGKLGVWDVFCGCFVGPGNVSRRFIAAVRGPGWG